MKLTEMQKTDLLTRFAPMLLLSDDDIGVPVDPAHYVSRCALWVGQQPKLDYPLAWGIAADGGARSPLLAKGSVTLEALPQANATLFKRSAGEFWLDCSGWLSAQNVTPLTDNRQPNLPALKSLFADAQPTLRAEVCDGTSWQQLGTQGTAAELLGLQGNELQQHLEGLIVINYIFLFPAHRASASQVFPDGVRYGADEYEADWACFSVILRSEENQTLVPVFGGFSRHMRSQSSDFGNAGAVLRFRLIAWDEIPKVDAHACVIAAVGTHNLYPADVSTANGHPTPQSAGMGFGDNTSDDVGKWVSDMVEENPHVPAAIVAVTLAKMAAGGALAGPFGALAGLVAGIAEAGPIAESLAREVDPPNIDPGTETPPDGELEADDDNVEAKAFTLLSPDVSPAIETQVRQLISFPTAITRVLPWSSRSYERINRDKEKFWPVHDGLMSTGYTGRWGVRCGSDPYSRRSGDVLPDFRMELVRNLLLHLPLG